MGYIETGPQKNWLLNIGGVPCNIYTDQQGDEAIIESRGDDGFSATVRFQCGWTGRHELAAGLLGTVGYTDGTVIRSEPFQYPLASLDDDRQNPGSMLPARRFCTAIPDVRGTKWQTDFTGGPSGLEGWGGYVYAIVTAQFSSPPYLIEPLVGGGAAFNDLLNQTYCITKTRVSGEVFAPPTGSFIFGAGTYEGRPLEDIGASQIRCRYELSCTRVRMPIVPIQTIQSLIGSVNQSPIMMGADTIGPGAALFTGANPEPRSDPYNGGIIYDVELTWLVNGIDQQSGETTDWNQFLDPSGVWEPVIDKVTGEPVFAYLDHSQLFSDSIA
jgi:hypothetical protein